MELLPLLLADLYGTQNSNHDPSNHLLRAEQRTVGSAQLLPSLSLNVYVTIYTCSEYREVRVHVC